MRNPETVYRHAMTAHYVMDQALSGIGEGAKHDRARAQLKQAMRDTYRIARDAHDEMTEDPHSEDAFEMEWDPRDEMPA